MENRVEIDFQRLGEVILQYIYVFVRSIVRRIDYVWEWYWQLGKDGQLEVFRLEVMFYLEEDDVGCVGEVRFSRI